MQVKGFPSLSQMVSGNVVSRNPAKGIPGPKPTRSAASCSSVKSEKSLTCLPCPASLFSGLTSIPESVSLYIGFSSQTPPHASLGNSWSFRQFFFKNVSFPSLHAFNPSAERQMLYIMSSETSNSQMQTVSSEDVPILSLYRPFSISHTEDFSS